MIHLHFAIVIARHSGSGRVYVSAATGPTHFTWTSAQIRFDVVRRGDSLSITSDSLGLVAGHLVRISPERKREIVFDNYIPYRGIKPGLNALTFELQHYGRARVTSLRFFADSGIRYANHSPARAALGVNVDRQRIMVGEALAIDVEVRNSGGSKTTPGLVGLDFSRTDMVAQGRVVSRVRPIPSGETSHKTFHLRALRAGLHEVDVEAQVGLSHPIVPFKVLVVGPTSRSNAAWRWWLGVASAILGVGVLGGIRLIRRRRHS